MKRCNLLVILVALGVFAVLYLPMLAVAGFSVNASKMGLNWGGFTLSWYQQLLHNEQILRAAWNTLVLAVVSTAFSTVIGTMLAIGMYRFPWSPESRFKLNMLLHLPVVTPDIIFAVALVIAFSVIRYLTGLFELGLVSMIVGHVTFQILRGPGGTWAPGADRARGGGGRLRPLRRLLARAHPRAAAHAQARHHRRRHAAFTLSLDDFVISFFTSGPVHDAAALHLRLGQARRHARDSRALHTGDAHHSGRCRPDAEAGRPARLILFLHAANHIQGRPNMKTNTIRAGMAGLACSRVALFTAACAPKGEEAADASAKPRNSTSTSGPNTWTRN
jgi:spermidine/putrescine transport system permease protein